MLPQSANSRIVVLTEIYPPDVGGSGVLLHEIYSRVSGAEVVVAVDRRSRAVTADGCGQRVVPLEVHTPNWGFMSWNASRHHVKLGMAVRRLAHGADTVVHCGRALPEGTAAWISRRLGGPSYVCWTHGEDVASALTSRELTLMMRRVYSGAAAVVANSENTRALLRSADIDADKIHVVYPGVDASRFHPQVDGTDLRRQLARDDEQIVLSVGRLQSRKGHDLAIQAMAALGAHWPKVRYIIIGDGEERDRLEALARSFGVSERVLFVGEVPSSLLPSFYAACDVFLLPNRIENGDVEGFGIVFLEAAAAGKPTVGGRSGGVVEAIAEGETGLLVSGTDVNELAHAIQRLLQDRELRNRLGGGGRGRGGGALSWEASAGRIERLHGDIVSCSTTRGGAVSA
jgi:phosphatidyl-myo-inositol dimannoside synthase